MSQDSRNDEWEYQTVLVQGDLASQLNKAGKDGWEAWAVLPHPPGAPAGTMIGMKRKRKLIEVRQSLNDGILHRG